MDGVDVDAVFVAFDPPRAIAIVAGAEIVAFEGAVRIEGHGPGVGGTAAAIVRKIRNVKIVEQCPDFGAGKLTEAAGLLREQRGCIDHQGE